MVNGNKCARTQKIAYTRKKETCRAIRRRVMVIGEWTSPKKVFNLNFKLWVKFNFKYENKVKLDNI